MPTGKLIRTLTCCALDEKPNARMHRTNAKNFIFINGFIYGRLKTVPMVYKPIVKIPALLRFKAGIILAIFGPTRHLSV
jgi:hypothetical protein